MTIGMTLKPKTFRHSRLRGFNLIEAAVVLAVVGLIIGGIWMAAAAVNENMQVSKTVETIFYVRNKADMLMTRKQVSASNASSTYISCNLGIYPDDIACSFPSMPETFYFKAPTGGKMYSFVNSNQIYFYFDNGMNGFTKSQCIKLVSQVFQRVPADDASTTITINTVMQFLRKNTANFDSISTYCSSGNPYISGTSMTITLPITGTN